jgi:lysophospholipase L1-like esterase
MAPHRPGISRKALLRSFRLGIPAMAVLACLAWLAWWWTGRPLLFQGEPYVYNPGPAGDLCPRRMPNLRDESSRLPDIPHLVTHEGHVLPNRRVKTYTYSTNAETFRGTLELERPKPAGVFRIGVFGTGVTFGNGVDDEWPWPQLLEERLGGPERGFQVYNMAIPGTTTDNGVDLVERYAPEMDLDLVIFSYGVNDGLTHKQRPAPVYKGILERLLEVREQHGLRMLFTIEPRSSFYPWPYEGHEQAFYEVFDGVEGAIVNLPRLLDALEQRHGLRLESEDGMQRVVEYRFGWGRTLYEVPWDPATAVERMRGVVWHHQIWGPDNQPMIIEEHYDPDKGVQSVSPDVYEFLDTHHVYMANFLDGVHLSEQGHVEVARLVHEELQARGLAP